MSTTYGATGLGQTAASTRRVSSFFKRYWGAFQERRKRQRLRAALCDLSDRELMDIGITRGEIDYVASNRGIDPRGIRSAEGSDIYLGGRANLVARRRALRLIESLPSAVHWRRRVSRRPSSSNRANCQRKLRK